MTKLKIMTLNIFLDDKPFIVSNNSFLILAESGQKCH
jgi:hypothetical protein